MTKSVALIIPYYNSPSTIEPLYDAIAEAMEGQNLTWTALFVNDCSPCDGWKRVQDLATLRTNARGLCMSHNVGQNLAIKAGLHAIEADHYVIMDCDLQDNPRYIPELLKPILNGEAEIVFARRSKSKDVGAMRQMFREGFYGILRILTGLNLRAEYGTYCAFGNKAAEYLRAINSRFQVFALNIRLVGFSTTEILVDRRPREVGNSSYSLQGLIRLAIYIMIRYSDKLVRFFMIGGFTISVLSFIGLMVYGLIALIGGFGVSGFATTVLLLIGYSGFQTL